MTLNLLSKRWLINALLIFLIGIIIYIGNRYQILSNAPIKNSITSLKPQDVSTSTIEIAGDRFVLRNSGNQWLLVTPIEWPANNLTLERLVSIVTSESLSHLPSEEIDLAALGLQYPQATLTLNNTRFQFGITNNIGERRYIMIGSTVYLLPDIHLHFINQGITALIDRRLLPPSIALKSLELNGLSLSKNGNGTWQNSAFGEIEADRLNLLVNNWQTLEAGQIKSHDQSKIPHQNLAAVLEDGSKIDFFLMSIKPEIVIARPDLGVQYHFSEKQFYDLLSIAKDK